MVDWFTYHILIVNLDKTRGHLQNSGYSAWMIILKFFNYFLQVFWFIMEEAIEQEDSQDNQENIRKQAKQLYRRNFWVICFLFRAHDSPGQCNASFLWNHL